MVDCASGIFTICGISGKQLEIIGRFGYQCCLFVLIWGLEMKEVDRRLDRMIQVADETGMTLDHVVQHMGRCDQTTFEAFSDNPSLLPRYTKSRETP